MSKYVVGQNGVVINVEGAPDDDPSQVYRWRVDDSRIVSIGDPFDLKDKEIDEVEAAVFQVIYRHENLIRGLIRAVRGAGAAANNSANNEGLPTTAQSQDLTPIQAKAAFKSLLP